MELVSFTAADDIRLHGALHPPAGDTQLGCDAAIFLHGAGSNFYSSTLLAGILPTLQSLGLSVLAINTRGHDAVCTLKTSQSGRRGGAAYEVVDECRHDIRGAVDFLAERGMRRIALMGHSLGALKAIYSQAHAADERVTHVIPISPPLLSYRAFCDGSRRGDFLQMMSRAEQLVAAGEGGHLLEVTIPLPLLITAAGYVDKYGPAERYNQLQFMPQVSQPMHYIFGEREVSGASEAFGGLDAKIRDTAANTDRDIDATVIAGADHFYAGCADELANAIAKWPTWQR